jgi:hypothetical protein
VANPELTPTKDQEEAIQTLNDRFGVDRWEMTDDASLVVTLDDGDIATVTPMGNWIIR